MKNTQLLLLLFLCAMIPAISAKAQICPYPTDYCSACPTVIMPTDAITCPGGPFTLTPSVLVPGGMTVKDWWWSSPGIVSPPSGTGVLPGLTTFTPPGPMAYTLSVNALGPNLIADGNFSAWTPASSCFYSGYTLNFGPAMPADNYSVGVDPFLLNPMFVSMADHTGDLAAKMLIANSGPASPLTPVWQEVEVPVCAGREYEFRAWYANLEAVATPAAAPILKVVITGQPGSGLLYSGTFSSLGGGVWNQIDFTWSSGIYSYVTVEIFEVNPSFTPVDFALDDISVNRLCTATGTINLNMPAITGSTTICESGPSTILSCLPGGGTWSSGAPLIATVDALTGAVTGMSAGTAVITYHSPLGCDVTTIVTVTPKLPDIMGPDNICAGTIVTYTNAVPGGVWLSSDVTIAYLSTSIYVGDVHGNWMGVTTISYTVGGCTVTKDVTVNPSPPTGLVYLICAGSSTSLPMVPAGGTWSGGGGIASVAPGGLLTALASGSTPLIYTTAFGCSASSLVYVFDCSGSGGGPAMSPMFLCEGQSVDANLFLAIGMPGGGSWSTSGPSVSIDATTGIVTGISGGTSPITYTVGGASFTGSVMVSPMPVVTITPSYYPVSGFLISGLPVGCSAHYTITLSGSGTPCCGGTYAETGTGVLPFSTLFGLMGCYCAHTLCIDNITCMPCTWDVSICAPINGGSPREGSSIHTEEKDLQLAVLPNPNNGSFTLYGVLTNDTKTEATAIEITDISGKVIHRSNATINNGTIDSRIALDNSIANGIYIIRVKANGINKVLKFELTR